MNISIPRNFSNDTSRSDDFEETIRFGADCEDDSWKNGRKTSLPLRRWTQCVYIALHVSTRIPDDNSTSFTGIPRSNADSISPIVASSACRFRLTGIRLKIPAEIACGESVVEE